MRKSLFIFLAGVLICAGESGLMIPANLPSAGFARPVNDIKIVSGKMSIEVSNQPLKNVLGQIRKLAGIQFILPQDIEDRPVTASIHAKDWASAVRSLLKDFSRVEIWNDKNQLAMIKLIEGRKTAKLEPQNSKTDKTEKSRKKEETFKILLSESQLHELAEVPPGQPVPLRLFMDIQFRRFLELNGINSPEDWAEVKKAKTARQKIGKELLKRRKQKKTGK